MVAGKEDSHKLDVNAVVAVKTDSAPPLKENSAVAMRTDGPPVKEKAAGAGTASKEKADAAGKGAGRPVKEKASVTATTSKVVGNSLNKNAAVAGKGAGTSRKGNGVAIGKGAATPPEENGGVTRIRDGTSIKERGKKGSRADVAAESPVSRKRGIGRPMKGGQTGSRRRHESPVKGRKRAQRRG